MSKLILNDKRFTVKTGISIFDLVGEKDIPIDSSCKKQGKCKECIVEIKSGSEFLSSLTESEAHLTSGYRLSCQAVIEKEGDILVRTLKRAEIRIGENGWLRYDNFKTEPAVYRIGHKVFIEETAVAETDGPLLGLAIDIGTTTVVVRLVDLEKATVEATASFENPQRYAGTNVMSRIAYDTEIGKKELKRVITQHLSDAVLSICDIPENIFEVIVGGNTTMRDLFFGLDVRSIGQKPYRSFTEEEVLKGLRNNTVLTENAKRLKLPVHPKARIYGLPVIGGHVGADTSAGLLAIDFMDEEKNVVFMDIGTNTEIVIGNKTKALAASSPSGPSFEGGGILCGMPALTGAVESVQFDKNNKVHVKTIGDEKPVGICGSGLIDVLGELTRMELINEFGRFEEKQDIFYMDQKNDIFISENDINLLAQAKAANIAAFKILVKNYGIDLNDIDTFYLAGGFGEHIDIDACIRIGLLPDIAKEKFKRIGNAAIEGLTLALLSLPKRRALEKFTGHIEQINLESDPDFFDYFVDGCLFQKTE